MKFLKFLNIFFLILFSSLSRGADDQHPLSSRESTRIFSLSTRAHVPGKKIRLKSEPSYISIWDTMRCFFKESAEIPEGLEGDSLISRIFMILNENSISLNDNDSAQTIINHLRLGLIRNLLEQSPEYSEVRIRRGVESSDKPIFERFADMNQVVSPAYQKIFSELKLKDSNHKEEIHKFLIKVLKDPLLNSEFASEDCKDSAWRELLYLAIEDRCYPLISSLLKWKVDPRDEYYKGVSFMEIVKKCKDSRLSQIFSGVL